jgi:hypothetical protein
MFLNDYPFRSKNFDLNLPNLLSFLIKGSFMQKGRNHLSIFNSSSLSVDWHESRQIEFL